MKIYIPYHPFFTGGPSSFLAGLARELARRKHRVTYAFARDFDALLVVEKCSLALLAYARLRGKRIIQRLDGVYHPGLPGRKGKLYFLKNLKARIIHNFLADHVIYQSRFARLSCQTMLGKRTDGTCVIYNGVELDPAAPRWQKAKAPDGSPLQLATAAAFRRFDQIKPILESVKRLNIPYHLHVYGPHTGNLEPLFKQVEGEARVTYHGAKTNAELTSELVRHNIFLFSDQSACPNAVLEALAAGLPVVAFNRGSIPELVKSGASGEVVAMPRHNPFRDSYPFTEDSCRQFATAIAWVSRRLPVYRQAAAASAKEFNMVKTAAEYEKVLNSL